MPTIPNIPGPYRFFFYSFDCNEPSHVHVRRERKTCKFWVNPVALAANVGFNPRELNQIRKTDMDRLPRVQETWNEQGDE